MPRPSRKALHFAGQPGDLRHLDAQLALARLAEPEQARRQHLDLLPQLRALPLAEQQRLAEVLEALNWQDADDPARRIGLSARGDQRA